MKASLSALPMRVARRMRRRLGHALFGRRGLDFVPIGRPHAGGVIDGMEMNDDGTLAVVGWSPDATSFAAALSLKTDAASMSASHVFRVTRPDLARLVGDHPERLGLVVEYVLPLGWSGRPAALALNGATLAEFSLPRITERAYSELYGNPGVWHRDQIYSVGPPVDRVSTEILDLCGGLRGPLLDFGCGAGVLVLVLRGRGIEAVGLELDQPEMRRAASPAARARITYYSGAFPAPFGDRTFASITCCEVLEHIPDYQQAVRELARMARERVLITVPDMSSIPRGFTHGVVPWHLMERSHVNFFTQQSLGDVLRPHFSEVTFHRIGEVRCERLRFHTSLVALCREPRV